nr:MAG TPA: hypothetical protein [Caudoviricetes sp.]DAR47762.1 MAG TPA: hypothetical protein [Caudoviricetes sp.]
MKKDEVNTQEVQEAQEAQPERVPITIPRGDKRDDSNLFVSVNGVNYLLPKGQTSMVPPEVAEEVKRSWEAERLMDEHSRELLESSKNPMNQ